MTIKKPSPPEAYAAPPMYAQLQLMAALNDLPYPTAYAPPEPPEPVRVEPYQNTSARLIQDRNATVAEVVVKQNSTYDFGAVPDFEFKATGSSKREKGDRFNARTGELLALSRAYLNLSRKLYAAGRDLVEPEPAPEYDAPEDNSVGVGAYESDPMSLEWPGDPTDEDVELAKEILTARADYNAFVAEHGKEPDWDAEAQAEQDEADAVVDPQIANAVLAFNAAADALNAATEFIRELSE